MVGAAAALPSADAAETLPPADAAETLPPAGAAEALVPADAAKRLPILYARVQPRARSQLSATFQTSGVTSGQEEDL